MAWPPPVREAVIAAGVGMVPIDVYQPAGEVEVVYRYGGAERCVGVLDLLVAPLRELEPMRRIVSYTGELRHPSLYWCSKSEQHIACESRHEERHLQLLDFDQTVTWVVAQPLRLRFHDRLKVVEHVPDFLIERSDGSRELIDITIPARLTKGVPVSYRWTASVCRQLAWRYSVRAALDPVLVGNVTLIAAAKRPVFGEQLYAERLLAAAAEPRPWGEVETAVGSRSAVRPVMLRLLWQGRLLCDLRQYLEVTTLVRATEVCR